MNEAGTPYFDVAVTVDTLIKNKKTYHAVSGTTDLNGNVTVREFEPGYRTVTVSGPTIISKTFGPYKFEHGKAIKETFVVAPSFNIPAPQQSKQKASA
jgi:hypothetical protein